MADHAASGATCDYDLFVIGGGSGGVRAARIAAGHGARVGIAEEAQWGGTCVNRGCIPKKLLVYASRYGQAQIDAQGFGWSLAGAFDWQAFMRAKDIEIARLEGVYLSNLEKSGVHVHACRAVLEDPHTVVLSDGSRVRAHHILIATGAHSSFEPRFAGREFAITSDDAFRLPGLPGRVLIVGGGYIAVEFAGIFAGLGADVTLAYRGEHLLAGMDVELTSALGEAYDARGIHRRPGTRIERVTRDGDALTATLVGGASARYDAVMLATGRVPNVAGLGLERVGVAQGKAGSIIVDGQARTNVPSIFAIGDVTGRLDATPIAIREGHYLADRLFGGSDVRLDYTLVPRAVFATPELGSVGLTEAVARERHGRIRVFRSRLRSMRTAFLMRDDRMMIKLIVDAATDRVVGAHVLADGASEIVQVIATAMRAGATKDDFDHTIALHPTIAEELMTLREFSD
ncbi:MAG: glutathione-disulfide reductase [Rhodocyclaceae bacterium]